MADINHNDIPNIETDWQGYSGKSVQKFIKEQLNAKMGVFYFDASNNRYLVFASEDKKNEYIADPTLTGLVLGTFDAPFNYSAEITLTSNPYNAVFLGTTGNAINFTFDIKNKQGSSTFENVTITYTFIRNSVKKTFTEKRKHGDVVSFNIDKYLDEGTNIIMISLVGETTLAATTASVTYQVVNLQLSDDVNIANVYDLAKGSVVAEFPFTVSGYGTKVVEWYLDGTLLPFVKAEDEVVDVTASRFKYITLSNLQQGRHSLQLRAYTTINGERFYTDTLYRDLLVYTGTNNSTMIGIATTIPNSIGVLSASDAIALYDVVQYIPYTLRFATYSPTGKVDTNVSVSINDVVKGVVVSNNGAENRFTFTESKAGSKNLILSVADASYSLPITVSPTTMNLEEITAGLVLDFNALGKSNNSKDRDTWTDGTYTGTLTGFNYNNTSGWVDGRLELNEGASFALDLAPLSGSPVSTGKTIEIEWASKDVSDEDTIICDMRDSGGVGILITATKVSIKSINGAVIETEYKSNENVRIGFVINRSGGVTEQRLSYIYANGIVSRATSWGIADDYTSSKEMVFTASAGALVSLKSIKVYNTALTSDNMLNNYTLYRDTVAEMIEVYDRNNIYEDGTVIFSPDRLSGRLPIMIVTGDIPTLENTSNKDTQITVDIEYTNLQDPSKSFKMFNAAMRPQGTSSMGYPKKNFRIYTQKLDNTIVYDSNGQVIENKLYSFKDGAQPVDCWCLKADYAESSGTHNTGIARMWNKALFDAQIDGEYKLRTEAQKAALSANYPYDVRTTIDGFPILLFYRPTVNDEVIFIGKYNFNNDKSTESVFGFTGIPNFDNSKMQCWEVLNNGNPLALFTTVDGFDSNWSEAFESRYPDTKTPNTADLKAFCQWMVNVSQSDFATQKWEHLNVYMMAAYWVYLMRHGAADQFVKNAMFTSEDGQHFYYILYDNDTINGLINTGRLSIQPTDDRQTKDDSGAYVFAGHDSRLWNMLEADAEFMEIIEQVDNALYSAGISYINAIRMFDEEQADKWVEKIYNQDARYKYIGPYVEKGINNLFMLQGKRDLHRRWWLANRFAIYDAKYVSGTYKSSSVELKCINGTPAGQQFTIKAGYPLDYGYGINNVPRSKGISLEVGQSHTFTTAEVVNLGDPIRIYGAPNIAEIDLSAMAKQLAVVTIANVYDEALGTRLSKFVMGKVGVVNREVAEISGLKQAEKLEFLDVQGMANMTTLDLSTHTRMKTVKAFGSNIASISLAKGAPVESLELPSAMRVLALEQLPFLQSSGIAFEDIKSLTGMDIKSCPNISNDFSFVYNWVSNKTASDAACYLMMDNVNWRDVSPDELLRVARLKTLSLKGTIVLNSINLEQINALIAIFGEQVFAKGGELYIDAPNAVFVVGRTSLNEGESEQYKVITFGSEVTSIAYSLYSGGNSNNTITTDGLLTTKEIGYSRELIVRIIVRSIDGTKSLDLPVSVAKRVYPTSSNIAIIGDSKINKNIEEYRLSYPSDVNGDFVTTWTMTVDTSGYVELESYDDFSCRIRKLKEALEVVKITLTATLKKRYNNSSVCTITKNIELVNDTIAETDIGIVTALYNAGLCASDKYITKEEAARVTAVDLNPGTSQSTAIFYSQYSNIKTFNGFKYFVNVTEIPPYCFYNCTQLSEISLPESITSIGTQAFTYTYNLVMLDVPSSVTKLASKAIYRSGKQDQPNSKLRFLGPIASMDSYGIQECNFDTVYFASGITNLHMYEINTKVLQIPSTIVKLDVSLKSYPSIGLTFEVYDNEGPLFSKDGILYKRSGNDIILVRHLKKELSVQIDDSVTIIGSSAFYINSGHWMTSCTLPKGVHTIDRYAFERCYNLVNIVIPDTVKTVNREAFDSCTSLTEITFPSIEPITLGDECFVDSTINTIKFFSRTAPSVTSSTFYRMPKNGTLYIPFNSTGYDSNVSGWDFLLNTLSWNIDLLYEPKECTSLTITADDVVGNRTNTTVYWNAMTNGLDITTNENVEGLELSGVSKSNEFSQNTSTTDTIQREVSFTYLGVTATTTITQGVWVESGYTINLNDQWRTSTITNPDSAIYDGVYESYSNYHINSGVATMYIDITGYETFKLYVRSYAETYSDYVVVSQLDQTIDGNTSWQNTTLVKAHTYGNAQQGTAISNYTLVEFTNISDGSHRITIIYRKDSSANLGNDRGYVLIPKNQWL